MIFLKAFIVGGIICALVQIVIDKTKVTPARIMVSLVCIGVVLGAIGISGQVVAQQCLYLALATIFGRE